MEDLWRLKNCGKDRKDIADIIEYRELLKRFNIEEEQGNRSRLLFGDEVIRKPDKPNGD